MEIRTLPAMHVAYSSYQTTLTDLVQYVGKADHLYKAGLESNVLPAGPVYWIYYGLNGQPDQQFTLETALPLSAPVQSKHAEFKTLKPFKCVTATYQGSWMDLPKVYDDLLKQISEQGLEMTGVSREAYINLDFKNLENNITEVQVEIK